MPAFASYCSPLLPDIFFSFPFLPSHSLPSLFCYPFFFFFPLLVTLPFITYPFITLFFPFFLSLPYSFIRLLPMHYFNFLINFLCLLICPPSLLYPFSTHHMFLSFLFLSLRFSFLYFLLFFPVIIFPSFPVFPPRHFPPLPPPSLHYPVFLFPTSVALPLPLVQPILSVFFEEG